MAKKALQFDEIGIWSEVKLEIVKKYAAAYSTILARQSSIKGHLYIDAFAGAGTHISKETGDSIAGSPVNALRITPPFTELHFIDLDGSRAIELGRLAAGNSRVTVHEGDCNDVLLRDVFPRCRYSHYRRALCLLDPYRLNVNWTVLQTAGQMKSVEVFYNFMIMDANMNVFLRDPGKVTPTQAARMDAVWGDGSWREVVYRKTPTLFGDRDEKLSNEDIAEAFRERLRDIAGFAYVPKPIPMRNQNGAVIYYLYFATPKAVAADIVQDIFAKYRDQGAV
ncbi:MAG TPA: three-Cys-motif partner protein TcmP [Vicinamibacterales bacterium]|nr:three-Cys-motif partner protein TcmP [Vicinamibacterales bacterium]